jgi:hypothetical protein
MKYKNALWCIVYKIAQSERKVEKKLENFTLPTKHQTTFFNCLLNNESHAPTPHVFHKKLLEKTPNN